MPVTVTAAVADRLFGAIEHSDITTVAKLFSPGIAVWKSGDTRDNDHARSVKIIQWFVDATVDRRYEILDRQLFDGGFVQQHVLHARTPAGTTIAMRVCIVIKVDADGMITRVDEYFDPAEIEPLLSTPRRDR
ncbi:nuclear transport factor 2 family protein [Mycobacterium sp. SMC-8]|uniref:nuclear transport factor 2 family protein n=1 Tax=Mycobacterium sp. SMC-8 TaxID=2857060 RepID=UPI0021B3631D|nr:nuclear transport factor 2 family protein [Mycobacterium sp. SMC-8]UXA09815.1 nuclear transport factor 2 family protein [Mycobacterium sp. SMC-8]